MHRMHHEARCDRQYTFIVDRDLISGQWILGRTLELYLELVKRVRLFLREDCTRQIRITHIFLADSEIILQERLRVLCHFKIVELRRLLIQIMHAHKRVNNLQADESLLRERQLRLIAINVVRVKFIHENLAQVGVRMQQDHSVLQCAEQDLVLFAF